MKDAYPIPDIQDALDNLRGARYFAIFDLLSRYWQLGMTDRAKERSAFLHTSWTISVHKDALQTLRSPWFILPTYVNHVARSLMGDLFVVLT